MSQDLQPTSDTDALQASIDRFSAAWDAGNRPAIKAFLTGGGVSRRLLVLELIHIDLERRLRTREGVRIEYYLRRFPELADSINDLADLAAAEFLHLSRLGKPVALADYVRRFPTCAAELERRLGAHVRSETLAGEIARDPQATAETLAARGSFAPTPVQPPAVSPGPHSVAGLLAILNRTPILKPAQLTRVVSELQHRYTQPSDLLKQLVSWDWLTKYQMEQILNGRDRDLIIGPYVVFDVLGAGGMGQVFKARHRLMNRLAAVKVIRQDNSNSESSERFLREVQAAASLSHPNIVAAYDASLHDDRLYLAMEYVPGVDLARLLHVQGKLPVMLAADYARQAALGLQHAFEKGMVHRDIKPSNLLLAEPDANTPGGRGVVKILDMGLARLTLHPADEGTALTQTGTVMGTPDYIAPEQSIDSRQADIRSDIYSLGCTLYHLLVGRTPFPRDTFMKKILAHQSEEPPAIEITRADVPAELVAVVRKMMAKKPEDRYQTPSAAAAALVPFCGFGQSVTAVVAPAMPDEIPEARLADAPSSVHLPPPSFVSRLTALAQTGVALTQKLPTDRRWFWPTVGGGAGLLVIMLAMVCLWPSGHPLHRMRADRIPAELRGKYLPEEVVAILGDTRAQHSKNISAICVSLDGNRIATAGGGEIHVSDAKTLKSTTVIPYEIAIHGLEFSPDGKKIIGACAHQLIQWDIASKKKDWIEDTSKNMAFGVYVTKAGKIISTRGDEKPVVRDADGKIIRTLDAEIFDGRSIVLSPDGTKVLYTTKNKQILVINTKNWKQEAELPSGGAAPYLFAYSNDSKQIALAHANTIAICSAEDGTVLRSITVPSLALSLSFLPGDRRIFSLHPPNFMAVWDTKTGDREWTGECPVETCANGSFPVLGGSALVMSDRRNLRLWDTATMIERLPTATPFAASLEFSPDGKQLLMVDQDVCCWDLNGLKQAYRFNVDRMTYPPLAISRDGTMAVVRGALPVLFDPRSGKTIERLPVLTNNAFQFTPDGKLLLADDVDAALTIRESQKPATEVTRFGNAKENQISAFEIFNDGKKGVSTNVPLGGLSFWKIPSGEKIKSWPIEGASCWNLRLSPDNQYLYGSVGAGELWIWNLATEKSQPEKRKAHGSTFYAMTIAKDGKTLLTCNGHELIQWEMPAGKKVQTWQNLNLLNARQTIAFAPDGRHAAAARADGRVLILRLNSSAK